MLKNISTVGAETVKDGVSSDASNTVSATDGAMGKSAGMSTSITAALASAGHTIEGAESELVLQPLRLAFETKNIKLVEPALDCLHVCVPFI